MKQEELVGFSLPRYSQIPDIGLLLEQTVRLINGYLEPLGSVSLTSSMVSNYVKHGIIERAVKKQYGRDQLAYLVFIAIAKTALSLDDIARLIELQRGYCALELAYDRFCDEFEAAISGRPMRNAQDEARGEDGYGFDDVAVSAEVGGNAIPGGLAGNGVSAATGDAHPAEGEGSAIDPGIGLDSGMADSPRLREVLCDIAAVSSMSILLRMKLEQLV